MARKWKKEDIVKVFELLIEKNDPVVSHYLFREKLSRDECLFVNQLIREANQQIAYKKVNFDANHCSDEEFWDKVEGTRYLDLIEDNAASNIINMAKKFKIVSE